MSQRKINHGLFSARSQEEANEYVKKLEVTDGMISVCAPYPATEEFIAEQGYKVQPESEWRPYEIKWARATIKEQKEIIEKSRQSGVYHPFCN